MSDGLRVQALSVDEDEQHTIRDLHPYIALTLISMVLAPPRQYSGNAKMITVQSEEYFNETLKSYKYECGDMHCVMYVYQRETPRNPNRLSPI